MEQTGSEMEIDICSTNPALVALFSVERIRNLMSNGKSVEIDETGISSSIFHRELVYELVLVILIVYVVPSLFQFITPQPQPSSTVTFDQPQSADDTLHRRPRLSSQLTSSTTSHSSLIAGVSASQTAHHTMPPQR